MSELGYHIAYITRVSYVKGGHPWPFPNAETSMGQWFDYPDSKLILRIEPYREVQGGGCGGSYSSYWSHSDCSVGLAIWWLEKVGVEDPAPPLTDYERVREVLGV